MNSIPESSFQLRFHVGPFPVVVEPSFWLMTALLGLSARNPALIALWVAIVFASILLHELGHAVASYAFGSGAAIQLYSFGGLTYHRPLSRWRSVAVAIAGPAAGLALGFALIALAAWGPAIESFALSWALQQAIWVNVGWSLMNLLPVLPLDGGHVLAGFLGRRPRATFLISGIVAAAVVAWSLTADERYLAILFGWMAIQNFMSFSQAQKEAGGPARAYVPPRTDANDAVTRGWSELSSGNEREAARLAQLGLDAASGADQRNRARDLLAWVALADGDARAALSHLDQSEPPGAARALTRAMALEALEQYEAAIPHALSALEREPSDTTAGVAARVQLRAGQLDGGESVLRKHAWANGALRDSLLSEVAFRRKDYAAAARLAEAAFQAGRRPTDAYNAACATARAGDPATAAAWLLRALDAGFDDLEAIERDEDLAPVRALPEIAQRLGAR